MDLNPFADVSHSFYGDSPMYSFTRQVEPPLPSSCQPVCDNQRRLSLQSSLATIVISVAGAFAGTALSQTVPAGAPTVVDAALTVRTAVSGLIQPTGLAFIGPNDMLVIEKASGRVLRVVNGVVQRPVLDLAVNAGSERGLLGIALHPNFAANGYVYLYWTESSTGVDSTNLADLGSIWGGTEPVRSNRIDRFVWNGSSLSFDRGLIRLRSYQADPAQPLRGNHDGGVIRFGPDGKLYAIMGDNGRRGWNQNLRDGPPVSALHPYGPADDQFGGPAPDNNHMTGMILRLNDDGTTPADNPFFAAGAAIGGEVGINIQKMFAYGVRNSFGMNFDPLSGLQWHTQNGDDSYGEINQFDAGSNGGWVQVMGPIERVADFKAIETGRVNQASYAGLQQLRWPPNLIADTPAEALARINAAALPGSRYVDPKLSWRFEVSPTALGFAYRTSLGAQYEGDMFVGSATPQLAGGFLFRLKLAADRKDFALSDPLLADHVADNRDKYDITESESLLFGSNFGGVTEIQTGPNGNLYVVSVTRGAIFEIAPR
jgi:glucose/arabinose dehydrogenase